MNKIKCIVLMLMLTLGLAMANDDVEATKLEIQNHYEDLYKKGQTVNMVGNVLSITGFGLVLASLSDTGIDAGGTGFLLYNIGLVSKGIGVGQMIDGVNGLNPNSKLSNKGWIPYGIGIGLDVLGVLVIVSGGSDSNDSDLSIFPKNFAEGLLLFGLGTATTLVSWGVFSYSAGKAEKAKPSIKLSFSPLISADQEGRLYGGLQTGFNF